jgi:hypothetical protein
VPVYFCTNQISGTVKETFSRWAIHGIGERCRPFEVHYQHNEKEHNYVHHDEVAPEEGGIAWLFNLKVTREKDTFLEIIIEESFFNYHLPIVSFENSVFSQVTKNFRHRNSCRNAESKFPEGCHVKSYKSGFFVHASIKF